MSARLLPLEERFSGRYPWLGLVWISILLISLWGPMAAAVESTMQLDLNEQRTIDLAPFSKIFAADRNVVAVRALSGNRRVILTGVGEGSTSITIVYADGRAETRRIRVIAQRIAAADLQLLIGGIMGIEIFQVGSNIAVRGAIRTQSEMSRYRKVVERFDNVIDLVEDLSTRDNIQLDVKVFEVVRSEVEELGVEWFQNVPELEVDFADEPRGRTYNINPSEGGIFFGEETTPELNTPVTVGKMARLSPLLVELRALEEGGYARLLAKPQIVAESGGKARFQVGGRLPYPVENTQGSVSVQFQDYGTIVEVEPQVLAGRKVGMRLRAEVSEPDYANSVLGTPGIRAREASTQVQVAEGETLAIAGLLSTAQVDGRRGLPLLAGLPLLGRLFGSDRLQVDEIETLILVTPWILSGSNSTVGTPDLEELRRERDARARLTPAAESESEAPEGW